jgi:YHS domain-containing protein
LKPTRSVPLPKEKRTQGIFKSHFNGKVYAWGSDECARLRSQTPHGVAKAMAEQWG